MAAKLNLEEGFKRFFWIVTIVGALGGFAMFVYGTVAKIGNIRELNHYRTILEKTATDPEFIALSKTDQKLVREEFEQKIQELENQNDWKGFLYGGLAFGFAWFLLLWLLFYAVRWIAQGFINKKIPKQ